MLIIRLWQCGKRFEQNFILLINNQQLIKYRGILNSAVLIRKYLPILIRVLPCGRKKQRNFHPYFNTSLCQNFTIRA